MESVSSPTKQKEQDEQDKDTRCGIGSFRPQWLQRLADPKAYLLLFCAIGILQGAYFTYTVGIISTIEKRYAFDSKISGIILIADNLSPIVTSLFIGYYGGQTHRPRLIAFGMLFVCLSCLMSALPYLVYGPGIHLLEGPVPGSSFQNQTNHQTCAGPGPEKDCGSKYGSVRLTAVSLFFVANFLCGFGNNAFYTVGMTYLDDNIKKKDSPLYFGLTMGIRLFGPSLGFFLSSVCLKYYEDPSINPGLSVRDPRWVGAWWMGYLIIFICLLFFTIPMFLFPKTMRKTQNPDEQKNHNRSKLPNIKDMPAALLKLAKNKIYVFHTLAVVFLLNGYMGYYILLPKYMEYHFRKSASEASLVSGATGLLTMLVGIMLGGFVIRKFKPRARILTGYIVFVQVVCVSVLAAVMFLACPTNKIDSPIVDGQAVLINQCNAPCDCNTKLFQPVCGADRETLYFSPCHAGCTGYTQNETTNATIFTGCACTTNKDEVVDLDSGLCPIQCQLFLAYILITCVAKLVSSTGRVGNTLITLRCVEPEEKTLALGVLSCSLCLLAMIPHPLVFGAIADSACLVWEEGCGTHGNCWLYDVDKLRLRLHGAAVSFVFLGCICDFLVWWYSGSLPDLYEEGHDHIKTSPENGMKPENDEINMDFVLKPVTPLPTGSGSDLRSNI